MKRPFHKGKKDKENEFAVSAVYVHGYIQCNTVTVCNLLNTVLR